MRRRLLAGAMVALGAVSVGCSATSQTPDPPIEPTVFAEGTTMAELSAAGSVRIGVKTDVPGLGYIEPGSPTGTMPEGFDVEIAKIVAAELNIAAENIEWVSMSTFDREHSIKQDKVDLVIASFSMTEDRAVEVGQAGPYFVTGQQLMVRDDETEILDVDDIAGRTVCAVAGATSNEAIIAKGAITKAYNSYRTCIDALLAGELDAVSTDGAILAGYIDQHPDDLRIAGSPFTTERYGIGYRHGDTALCEFLVQVLLDSYEDGTWKAAYESTLGKDGLEAPRAPRPDDCA